MAIPTHDMRRAAAIASALVAAPAWASDPRGLLGALLHLPVFVWAGINLLACLVLALFGAYRSRRVATAHAWIAAAGPAFGLLALLMDAGGQDIGTLLFAVDATLLALACLPLWLHAKQRSGIGPAQNGHAAALAGGTAGAPGDAASPEDADTGSA